MASGQRFPYQHVQLLMSHRWEKVRGTFYDLCLRGENPAVALRCGFEEARGCPVSPPERPPSSSYKVSNILIRRVHRGPYRVHHPLLIPHDPPSFPQVPPFRVREILAGEVPSSKSHPPSPADSAITALAATAGRLRRTGLPMKSQISKSKFQTGDRGTAGTPCLELGCLEIGISLELLSAIALAKADGAWNLDFPACRPVEGSILQI